MVVAGLGLLGSLCFPQHPHTSVWGVYAFFCLGSKPRSRIAGSPGSSCAPLLGVCPGGVSQGVHRSVFPQGSPCAPFPHPPTPALHFPSPPLCAPPLPLQWCPHWQWASIEFLCLLTGAYYRLLTMALLFVVLVLKFLLMEVVVFII